MVDNDYLLHRQVNPAWVQQGRLASLAFTPMPKDEGLLSVYDGALIDPERSFIHYTGSLKLTAQGTVSVTRAEVASAGLPHRPDPEPFPEHAVIDFTLVPSAAMSQNQIKAAVKAKAAVLAEKARQRGWTFVPS